MKSKVISIVAQVLNLPPESVNESLDAENFWDSLKKVEILLAVEEEFDIVLSQDEISGMKSVNSILSILKSRM